MPRLSDFRSEEEILKEKLYFLLLPDEEERFGGLGLSVDGDKSHLLGAINVDTSGGDLRPFLKFCIRKYGQLPFSLMPVHGDSYFYSEMFVDDDSLAYAEEDDVSREELRPLLDQYKKMPLPPFRFQLRLDKEKKLWMAYLLVDQ